MVVAWAVKVTFFAKWMDFMRGPKRHDVFAFYYFSSVEQLLCGVFVFRGVSLPKIEKKVMCVIFASSMVLLLNDLHLQFHGISFLRTAVPLVWRGFEPNYGTSLIRHFGLAHDEPKTLKSGAADRE